MTALTAAAAVAVLVLAAGPLGAASPRTWHLENILACHTQGTTTTCGPHLQMQEGGGNGTFPSGYILVREAEARIWVAAQPEASGTSFGTATWTLHLGGAPIVGEVSWIVGSMHLPTGVFVPASGTETSVAASGTSTFTPSVSFSVPAGHAAAMRITGASSVPTLVDVHDEAGGDSPSTLTVSG